MARAFRTSLTAQAVAGKSKSDTVRMILQEPGGLDQTTTTVEIIDELERLTGARCHDTLVSNQRTKVRKERLGPEEHPQLPPSNVQSSAVQEPQNGRAATELLDLFQKLRKVRDLSDEVGGPDRLGELLEFLRELRR